MMYTTNMQNLNLKYFALCAKWNEESMDLSIVNSAYFQYSKIYQIFSF